MDQNRMPLVEALQQFREEAPAYFRIPGHRFERGLDETLNGASLAAYDLSEAEGLDDLHHAEGVIAEAQKLAAETWKAKKTFFLVNGTTCGNEAMVLSSVKEGEKIIVPRNVHKSVLMGLILSGATPDVNSIRSLSAGAAFRASIRYLLLKPISSPCPSPEMRH